MATHDNDPLELQQALVEGSLPLVFQTYDQAVEQQIDRPVVLVIDCEDELGGEIARGWLGEEAVANAIAVQRQADDEQTTIFTYALDWPTCQAELSEAFPYLADFFAEAAPIEGVPVVSIAAGGASILTAPFEAR